MKRNFKNNLMFLVLGLLAIPLSAQAGVNASVPTTAAVWAHHIEAWQNRDLTTIMADYTDESVDIVVNKTYRGTREITELFSKLFQLFDGAKDHVVDPAVIEGKVVYITWHAVFGGKTVTGTDTFVIENGKITYQTITSDPKLFE